MRVLSAIHQHERLHKTPIRDLAAAYGILYDRNRLEQGKATQIWTREDAKELEEEKKRLEEELERLERMVIDVTPGVNNEPENVNNEG